MDFFSSLYFFLCVCILGPPYCGIGATIRIGREINVSRMRDFDFFLYQALTCLKHVQIVSQSA